MGAKTILLDLFFPPKCAFCREIFLQRENTLCSACRQELSFLEGERAVQPGEFYSVCVSPLVYEERVRESVRRYKFEGARSYRHPYAALMASCIAEHFSGRYDLLSWVPVSRARLRQRGYDQAKILAEAIGKTLKLAPVETLKKVKNTPAQSGLGGRKERSANISGAYRALCPETVSGKRILLIDDVVTTGSTLSESAHCLLQAGAQEVLAATLARAQEEAAV